MEFDLVNSVRFLRKVVLFLVKVIYAELRILFNFK